jgi:hypothetical protein
MQGCSPLLAFSSRAHPSLDLLKTSSRSAEPRGQTLSSSIHGKYTTATHG